MVLLPKQEDVSCFSFHAVGASVVKFPRSVAVVVYFFHLLCCCLYKWQHGTSIFERDLPEKTDTVSFLGFGWWVALLRHWGVNCRTLQAWGPKLSVPAWLGISFSGYCQLSTMSNMSSTHLNRHEVSYYVCSGGKSRPRAATTALAGHSYAFETETESVWGSWYVWYLVIYQSAPNSVVLSQSAVHYSSAIYARNWWILHDKRFFVCFFVVIIFFFFLLWPAVLWNFFYLQILDECIFRSFLPSQPNVIPIVNDVFHQPVK